jgi:hypothetical protein
MTEKKEIKAELVKPSSNIDAQMAAFKANAKLSATDRLRRLQNLIGGNASDVEVISAGKLPFWPAFEGAELIGTVKGRREVPTQYGPATLYTVALEGPTVAANQDGEPFAAKAGDLITVLERTVLKGLEDCVGKRVAIMCLGKVTSGSSGNEYYDYMVFAQKPAAPALPATA